MWWTVCCGEVHCDHVVVEVQTQKLPVYPEHAKCEVLAVES